MDEQQRGQAQQQRPPSKWNSLDLAIFDDELFRFLYDTFKSWTPAIPTPSLKRFSGLYPTGYYQDGTDEVEEYHDPYQHDPYQHDHWFEDPRPPPSPSFNHTVGPLPVTQAAATRNGKHISAPPTTPTSLSTADEDQHPKKRPEETVYIKGWRLQVILLWYPLLLPLSQPMKPP